MAKSYATYQKCIYINRELPGERAFWFGVSNSASFGSLMGFSRILSLSEKTTNCVPAFRFKAVRIFFGRTICPFVDIAVIIGMARLLSKIGFSYLTIAFFSKKSSNQ